MTWRPDDPMERQHTFILTAALLVATLAGCVSAPLQANAGLQMQAPVKAPLKVNKQEVAITAIAPTPVGTGAIKMEFVFGKPASTGYSLKATYQDVEKITVALKTRTFLLTRTVATADVTKAQILEGRAAVNFTGLAEGSYTLDITAFDAGGTALGATTATAQVSDGQTTTVDATLQVSPPASALPAAVASRPSVRG